MSPLNEEVLVSLCCCLYCMGTWVSTVSGGSHWLLHIFGDMTARMMVNTSVLLIHVSSLMRSSTTALPWKSFCCSFIDTVREVLLQYMFIIELVVCSRDGKSSHFPYSCRSTDTCAKKYSGKRFLKIIFGGLFPLLYSDSG